jgi:NADH dehydrogenase
MPALCEQYHIARNEIKLFIVDALDRLIAALPERLSEKAAKRLSKMGAEIRTVTKVVEVSKESITIEAAGKTETIDTSTVIWTAGIEGSEIVSGADIEKVRGKRIETNQYLQSKQYEHVYIVGDNIFYIPEGEKAPVPQMVENCEASAHTAADNILSEITEGKTPKHPYQPKFHGMMVSIGGRYGTAYVGTHKKKFALPSFFAMFVKHMINIVYFIQVLGWHKVYNYLLHEIFRVRHNRSFVGGHFANSTPSFWTVPLRLYLGYCWLIEGWEKMWKVVADPTNIFLFSIPDADGVASATEVVTDATATVSQAVYDYGEALPVPGFIKGIVDWSMGTFVAPIAPYFQAAIVIAEIVIGICLLIGLFTTVFSVFSCILCLMIYSSGMAAASILWHFVASVAVIGIGGTGHAFSIDYYILPRLKRAWKKLGFVRKWYIYND